VRAQDIARELGSARLEAAAALALANGRSRASGPTAARPLLTTALDKAIAAGDPALAAEVCATLSNSYYWTGEMQTARAHAEHRLQLAEEARDVFAMRHAHSWLALVSVSLGQFGRARDLLAAAEPGLRRLQSPEPIAFLQIVSAYIDYQTGDGDSAYRSASDAIALFERVDPNTLVWYEGVLVLACIASGREAEARLRIAGLEGRLRDLPDEALPARSARTALGLAYALLGESSAGEACERALRPHPHDHHWLSARRTLACLAALRGDLATAREDLRLAEEHTRAQAMLPDLALVLLHRAELEQRLDVQPDTSECRALLESLGMRPALSKLDAIANEGSLGATVRPSAGAASSSPGDTAGLTARELEVLRLLAEGLTNAEIAGRLILSERTVSNHLSHIFGKIEVSNRAGAVAFAHRHGLT
jgi:DNA-binding CsgD family transcriptional regulator